MRRLRAAVTFVLIVSALMLLPIQITPKGIVVQPNVQSAFASITGPIVEDNQTLYNFIAQGGGGFYFNHQANVLILVGITVSGYYGYSRPASILIDGNPMTMLANATSYQGYSPAYIDTSLWYKYVTAVGPSWISYVGTASLMAVVSYKGTASSAPFFEDTVTNNTGSYYPSSYDMNASITVPAGSANRMVFGAFGAVGKTFCPVPWANRPMTEIEQTRMCIIGQTMNTMLQFRSDAASVLVGARTGGAWGAVVAIGTAILSASSTLPNGQVMRDNSRIYNQHVQGSSYSFTHSANALVILSSAINQAGTSPTTVTIGGSAMTLLRTVTYNSSGIIAQEELWYAFRSTGGTETVYQNGITNVGQITSFTGSNIVPPYFGEIENKSGGTYIVGAGYLISVNINADWNGRLIYGAVAEEYLGYSFLLAPYPWSTAGVMTTSYTDFVGYENSTSPNLAVYGEATYQTDPNHVTLGAYLDAASGVIIEAEILPYGQTTTTTTTTSTTSTYTGGTVPRYCLAPDYSITLVGDDSSYFHWQDRQTRNLAATGCAGQRIVTNGNGEGQQANGYLRLETAIGGILKVFARGYYYGATSEEDSATLWAAGNWNASQGVTVSNMYAPNPLTYAWYAVVVTEKEDQTGLQFAVVEMDDSTSLNTPVTVFVDYTYNASYSAAGSATFRSLLKDVTLTENNTAWVSFSYWDGVHYQIESFELHNVWGGSGYVTVRDYSAINSAIPEGIAYVWSKSNDKLYGFESPIYFNETAGTHQVLLWDLTDPTAPAVKYTTVESPDGPITALYDLTYEDVIGIFHSTNGYIDVVEYNTLYGTINDAMFHNNAAYSPATGGFLYDLSASDNDNGVLIIAGLWKSPYTHSVMYSYTNNLALFSDWYNEADNSNGHVTERISLTPHMQPVGPVETELGYLTLGLVENGIAYYRNGQYAESMVKTTTYTSTYTSACLTGTGICTYTTTGTSTYTTSLGQIVLTGTIYVTSVSISTVWQTVTDGYTTISSNGTLTTTYTGTTYVISDLPSTIAGYSVLLMLACIGVGLAAERSILALVIGACLGAGIVVAVGLVEWWLLIPVVILAAIAVIFSSRSTSGEG
jgi:hypothetical protein